MKIKSIVGLACIAATSAASPVGAQTPYYKNTVVDFETFCAAIATPFTNKRLTLSGGTQFAACGIAEISAPEAGFDGAAHLYRPSALGGIDPIATGDPIADIGGDTVLIGDVGTGLGSIKIRFTTPVNELTFRVIDLDEGGTLTITAALGVTNVPVTVPAPVANVVSFGQSFVGGIDSVTIDYGGVGQNWAVDDLRFNAWHCGDGGPGGDAAEPGEACDDGNGDHCDLCGNTCTATINGCSNNGTCVANGQPRPGTVGCAVCQVGLPALGNDNDWNNAALGQACDDGLFCTLGDQCNGLGACASMPRTCPDVGGDLACTVGTCNETTDQCDQAQTAGCLINGACVLEGQFNPNDACERCNSTVTRTAWSKVPAGGTCGEPSCMAGMLTPAPVCSTMGTCVEQAAVTCDGAVCADSVSCTGACQTDADCLNANHCQDGKCLPDGDPGDACKRGGECASGFCADGVCCDQACDRVCEACNMQGKAGMCGGFASGTDPDNECPDAQICASAGLCVPEDRPNGTTCDSDAVCESGHCADGVCCNSLCNSDCEACNIMGTVGTCTFQTVGTDPQNECGGVAVCSGSGECVSYETRGNGLCNVDFTRRTFPAWSAWFALLGLTFARRRRHKL